MDTEGIKEGVILRRKNMEGRIVDCLKIHYGIDVATLTPLSLGADRYASVYKAQTHSQSSYFVKLKQGHYNDISATVTGFLHDSGISNIIPPLKTINGHTTQRIENFTLTVFPFIEGCDGFSRDLTNDQWQTLGKVIRQIHDINVPSELQITIQRESYAHKASEVAQSLYPLIDLEPRGDTIAVHLLTFLKKHKETLHRLVTRNEQLAEIVKDQSFPFVLCHADLHAGNILIDKDNRIYIVDWDAPILAPKERDLMFIGGGVGNVWNKPFQSAWFYKGYGKNDINQTLLAYFRHARILEDIAEYTQALLLTTVGKEKDQMNMCQALIAQFDPQGVVDIAFQTDNELAM